MTSFINLSTTYTQKAFGPMMIQEMTRYFCLLSYLLKSNIHPAALRIYGPIYKRFAYF